MNNYFITLQKLSKTFILVVFKPQPTKQLIYSCERVLKKQLKTGRLVDTSSIRLDWMLSKSLTMARLSANVCGEASSQMLILQSTWKVKLKKVNYQIIDALPEESIRPWKLFNSSYRIMADIPIVNILVTERAKVYKN